MQTNKSKKYFFIISTLSLVLISVLGPISSSFVVLVLLVLLSHVFARPSHSYYVAGVSAVTFVGLSPLYLVIRGFITKSNLNSLDLLVYLFAFIFLWGFVNRKVENEGESKCAKLNIEAINKSLASLSGFFVGVAAYTFLKLKSSGDLVAWIASGDSKNHFVNGVQIIDYGYLNPFTFLSQPVSSPTFLALILGKSEITYVEASQNLEQLMSIYAFVWVVLIGILGLVLASLAEIIWRIIAPVDKPAPYLLIATVSILPVFNFVIGPLLFDGFFTAIFGLSTVILITAWFLSTFRDLNNRYASLFQGLIILFCSLTAWMFILPVTTLIYLLGIRNKLLRNQNYSIKIDSLLIFCVVGSALAIHFSAPGQKLIFKVKSALNATGAVNISDPNLYYASILLILAIAINSMKKYKLFSKLLFQLAAIHLLALLAFKGFSNLSLFNWNYYLLKYQGITSVSLVLLLLTFSFIKLFILTEASKAKLFLNLTIASIVIFLFSEMVVPTKNTWNKIFQGWENPRSTIMNEVFATPISNQNPTLFFHYGYAGDARLANFWLTAFADPIEPIKGWNYTINTDGNPQQLCDVNAYYPTVNVITQDSQLGTQLKAICPSEEFIISFEKK